MHHRPASPRPRRTFSARLEQLERDATAAMIARLPAMTDAELLAIVAGTPPDLAARFAAMTDAQLAAFAQAAA